MALSCVTFHPPRVTRLISDSCTAEKRRGRARRDVAARLNHYHARCCEKARDESANEGEVVHVSQDTETSPVARHRDTEVINFCHRASAGLRRRGPFPFWNTTGLETPPLTAFPSINSFAKEATSNLPKNVRPTCQRFVSWFVRNTRGKAPKNKYKMPNKIAK